MFVWGDWRVSLVVLGCMPISGILMSVAMEAQMPMDQAKQGKQDKDEKQNKSAGSIVGEVVLSIRTVASFNAEQRFYDEYEAQVDAITKKGVPRAFTGGVVNGLAMGLMYLIFGVQIYYGFWLMDGGHLLETAIVRDASGCVTTDLTGFFDKVMVPIMAMSVWLRVEPTRGTPADLLHASSSNRLPLDPTPRSDGDDADGHHGNDCHRRRLGRLGRQESFRALRPSLDV